MIFHLLYYVAAKEREKAQKRSEQSQSADVSRTASPVPKGKKNAIATKLTMKSGISTPARGIDHRMIDLSALNLTEVEEQVVFSEEIPKASFAREKLLEEARKAIEAEGKDRKKEISLVVIGKTEVNELTCTVVIHSIKVMSMLVNRR